MTLRYRASAHIRKGVIIGGRYQIGDEIGGGGSGVVFTARHIGTGRMVAIKVLGDHFPDRVTALERLGLEARLAASISRRGVVEVLDFDVDSVEGPYMVMELLRGESLRQRLLRVGRLSPMSALSMALELLQTLKVVHEQLIVHRDLKPENIFFAYTDEGEEVVKILDFGISCIRQGGRNGQLTGPRGVLGTFRYIPFEQASGEPTIDGRADLYSVGAILYEALSGRKPYLEVPNELMLANVLHIKPCPLQLIAPDLSSDLVALVERAMARSREDRFQSSEEMLGAIEETLIKTAPTTEDIILELVKDSEADMQTPDRRESDHPLHVPDNGVEDTAKSVPSWLLGNDDYVEPISVVDPLGLRRRRRRQVFTSLVIVLWVCVIVAAVIGASASIDFIYGIVEQETVGTSDSDCLAIDTVAPLYASEPKSTRRASNPSTSSRNKP